MGTVVLGRLGGLRHWGLGFGAGGWWEERRWRSEREGTGRPRH